MNRDGAHPAIAALLLSAAPDAPADGAYSPRIAAAKRSSRGLESSPTTDPKGLPMITTSPASGADTASGVTDPAAIAGTRQRRSHPRRPPATAITAIVLSVVAAVVGGYGAWYFTGLDEWTPISEVFVMTYLAFSLFGLVCAGALLFGSGSLRSAARYGVAAYGVWMICFTAFKLVRFAEYQAIPFGVVGLLIVFLGAAPRTRAWAG